MSSQQLWFLVWEWTKQIKLVGALYSLLFCWSFGLLHIHCSTSIDALDQKVHKIMMFCLYWKYTCLFFWSDALSNISQQLVTRNLRCIEYNKYRSSKKVLNFVLGMFNLLGFSKSSKMWKLWSIKHSSLRCFREVLFGLLSKRFRVCKSLMKMIYAGIMPFYVYDFGILWSHWAYVLWRISTEKT